jgi:hypothetical protein
MNTDHLELKLFTTLLIALTPCIVSAANWVTVSVDSQENVWQIDVESISGTSLVELWTKTEYKKPQYPPASSHIRSGTRTPADSSRVAVGLPYVSAKNKVSINCSSKTLQVTYFAYYDSKGALVASGNSYSSEPIIPGSIGETLFSFVCKGK